MPIYKTNEQTGRDRIVTNLIGDVSTDAPIEYGGIPFIAHLVNEALKVNQVNVCYVYTTEGDLVVGAERRYGLWTTRPIRAGHGLLADYGKSYLRTWDGLHQRGKRQKKKHTPQMETQAPTHEGPPIRGRRHRQQILNLGNQKKSRSVNLTTHGDGSRQAWLWPRSPPPSKQGYYQAQN